MLATPTAIATGAGGGGGVAIPTCAVDVVVGTSILRLWLLSTCWPPMPEESGLLLEACTPRDLCNTGVLEELALSLDIPTAADDIVVTWTVACPGAPPTVDDAEGSSVLRL